jgi:hypothetical protein
LRLDRWLNPLRRLPRRFALRLAQKILDLATQHFLEARWFSTLGCIKTGRRWRADTRLLLLLRFVTRTQPLTE